MLDMRPPATGGSPQVEWTNHLTKCSEDMDDCDDCDDCDDGYDDKVNRCLARYSPRATTSNRPTNRALNKPAWPGPN